MFAQLFEAFDIVPILVFWRISSSIITSFQLLS